MHVGILDALFRWSAAEEREEESAAVRFMSPHSVAESGLSGITITNQIR